MQSERRPFLAFRKDAPRSRERTVPGTTPARESHMQRRLQVLPESPQQVRDFLIAQLRWERYRASRMVLVHLLALSAVCFWLPIPEGPRAAVAAASAACFLGALFAGMMEWRWGRERNRHAGALSPPGEPH